MWGNGIIVSESMRIHCPHENARAVFRFFHPVTRFQKCAFPGATFSGSVWMVGQNDAIHVSFLKRAFLCGPPLMLPFGSHLSNCLLAHLTADWSDAAYCQSLRQRVLCQITRLFFCLGLIRCSTHASLQRCASFAHLLAHSAVRCCKCCAVREGQHCVCLL